MFSLMISLIVCGVSVLGGTEAIAAVDYCVNLCWWLTAIFSLMYILIGFTMVVCGLAYNSNKFGELGMILLIASILCDGLSLFGLTLVSAGINPTELTNIPLCAIGTLVVLLSQWNWTRVKFGDEKK
jgi:hypothetical protein